VMDEKRNVCTQEIMNAFNASLCGGHVEVMQLNLQRVSEGSSSVCFSEHVLQT